MSHCRSQVADGMTKLMKRIPRSCFAARTRDLAVRKVSSSGGVFTELAKVVLADGGVVFGAGWARNPLRVVHQWVDSEAGLAGLRGSKYSVSDMTGVYAPMKQFLSQGRKVLFVGTPCQTAAIRKTFGEAENLVLCSLICMANLAAEALQRFVGELEHKHGSEVRNLSFRDKSCGWQYPQLTVEFEDATKNFSEYLYTSRYFRRLEAAPRKVCMRCPFRGGANGADLLIGDFWGLERQLPEWDDGWGVNSVLAYTARGEDILKKTNVQAIPVRYEQILLGNPYLEKQYVPTPRIVKFVRRVGRFALRHVKKHSGTT